MKRSTACCNKVREDQSKVVDRARECRLAEQPQPDLPSAAPLSQDRETSAALHGSALGLPGSEDCGAGAVLVGSVEDGGVKVKPGAQEELLQLAVAQAGEREGPVHQGKRGERSAD